MIRILLAFIVVFGLYYFGIRAFRSMTGQERWTAIKYLTYSFGLSIITLATLIGIVVIF